MKTSPSLHVENNFSENSRKPSELMSASLAEEKFLRNQMSPSTQDFYRKMKQFPKELSSRHNFIRNMRSSTRNLTHITSKCQSFTEKTKRNLPKLSPEIISYAMEMNILKVDDLKGMIVDPNKYSIFFEDHDFESPMTRNALKNLNFKPELVKFPNFKDFEDPNIPKINQILSYLIDLNRKYERYKLLMRERNRLKDLDREIKRKFPYYENLSLDDTMKSVKSLNETLNRPIEKNPKLYLNHSNTYTFDEKKIRNTQKLELFKQNMMNYVKNMTVQKFDGDDFLTKKTEKLKKIFKNKSEKLKVVKEKAKELVEKVRRISENQKASRSASRIKEEYEKKMKEIKQREEMKEKKLEEEHEKTLKKLEDFINKRQEYQKNAEVNRSILNQKEDIKIAKKLKNLDEKDFFLEKKREIMEAKIEKYRSIHEERLEEIRKKALEIEKNTEDKRIEKYVDHFEERLDKCHKKKEELIKKKLKKQFIESQTSMETVKQNRAKMIERQKNKEEYFKKKLKNDTEKLTRAQNIKEFIRRKTIIEVEDKFKKNKENKEEIDVLLDQKRVTIIIKDIQNKRKIDFSKKENDFVVRERMDYNTKLRKYRENLKI